MIKKLTISILIFLVVCLKFFPPILQSIGFYIFIFIILFVFSLIFHELGHVIGCLITRTKIIKFVVMCFSIEYSNQKYKIHWNKKLSWYGGMVQYSIDTQTKNIYKNGSIIAISGPLASFVLFLLTFVTSFLIPNFIFDILSILNLSLFCVTILPYYSDGIYSDGYQFSKLWKNDNYFKTIYLMSSFLNSDIIPEKWPEIDLKSIEQIVEKKNLGELVILASYTFYQSQFISISEKKANLIFNEYQKFSKSKKNDITKQLYLAYALSYNLMKDSISVSLENLDFQELDDISRARVNCLIFSEESKKSQSLQEYDQLLNNYENENLGFWLAEKQFNKKLHQRIQIETN